jgi:hypothetical protein
MKKLPSVLITLTLMIAPLQLYAVKVGGSLFDLALLPFSVLVFNNLLNSQRISKVILVLVLGYCAVFFIVVPFLDIPTHRVLSATTFYIMYGYVLTSMNIRVSVRTLRAWSLTLILACVAVAIMILYQYFLLGQSRPKGPFSEPSGAGLYLSALLFSSSALYLFPSHSARSTSFLIMKPIFLLCMICPVVLAATVLTKSINFGVLFCALLILQFLIPSQRVRKTTLFLVSLILITLVSPFLLNHFAERVLSFEQLNLSQLAWLQGLSQALHVLQSSPVWGFGPGATGYLAVESEYAQLLEELDFPGLNAKDAYSGFNRLIIELGLLSILLLGSWMRKSFQRVNWTFRGGYNESDIHMAFFYMFGLGLLLGILVKEPVWSRSFAVISILLLGISASYFRERCVLLSRTGHINPK